jgi:hypothetical protein
LISECHIDDSKCGGMVQYLGIVNGGGGNDASHVTGTQSSNG